MICKWNNNELYINISFLPFCLSFRVWKKKTSEKNLRTKTNRNKIEQKINTELALYPLSHILTGEKKDATGFLVPISILLVKPFAFGK